MTLLLGNIYRN